MPLAKVFTSITIGLALAGSLQLANTTVCVNPAFADSSIEVLLADSKSSLEGVKNKLTDFDSKLEYPMSDAEKDESQKKLNAFRSSFSVTKSKVITPKLINDKANEALNLGKLAIKNAESGDRNKALASFTNARIKLFESKSLLAEFESRQTANITPVKKHLSASARKEDKLLVANNAQNDVKHPSQVHKTSGVNQTNVNIGPNGITVEETQGNLTVRHSNVAISPSGINVSENTGFEPNTNTRVNINHNGIQVNKSGAYGGTRTGLPGEPSSINIDSNGIQVGSTGQAGRGAVSINANGINIGGLGDLEAALGKVGGALGSTNIAISQTGAGLGTGQVSTGISLNPGTGIIISGHGENKTLKLNGQNVLISGHSHNVRIIGYAGSVSVTGHSNNVKIDTVGNLSVSGHNNNVLWKNGPKGKLPRLTSSGRNNEITRIR